MLQAVQPLRSSWTRAATAWASRRACSPGSREGHTRKETRMLSLNNVMIGSDDPQGLSAFYTKVLGEPAWQDGGFVGWQAGHGMLMIGPHSEVKGRNEMPGR